MTVVVGEAEPLWPQLVEDAAARPARAALRGARWPVLRSSRRADAALRAARPRALQPAHRADQPRLPAPCDFCASSILLTPRYSGEAGRKVIAEIRRIKEIWPHPFIEFADDNSFVQRRHGEGAAARRSRPSASTGSPRPTSAIADDEELLDLMRESGCRQVLIGLESPVAGRARRRSSCDATGSSASCRTTRRRCAGSRPTGITVNGCFILGLDGHDADDLRRVYEFVDRTGLYEVQITVLTPFPGTPLYRRLAAAGAHPARPTPGTCARCSTSTSCRPGCRRIACSRGSSI